jgi:hypothetical protein
MSGVCMGTPVADGTTCGSGKICTAGVCTEAAPPTDATLFSDDFETGDLSRWVQKQNVIVQKTEVAAGTYAARATTTGSATYAKANLSAEQSDLYTRVLFKVLSQGTNSFFLHYLLTAGGARRLGIQVDASGKLGIYNGYSGRSTWSATTVAAGAWHELQTHVRIAGTASQVEVWLDGMRIDALSTTANLGTSAIGMVQIGDSASGRTFDVAFDDVAACVGVCSAVTPDPGGGDPSGPGDPSTIVGGALLASYNFHTDSTPYYAAAKYRPRQFSAGLSIDDPLRGSMTVDDPGEYAGWDVLTTLNYGKSNSDWLEMRLNRSATLAIVWRAGTTSIPSWLKSWAPGGAVTVDGDQMPTYKKVVSAGQTLLGGVFDAGDNTSGGRDTYWVLFAEADGKRSAPPPVPSGRDVPQPNQTCPTWVHDQYMATAPDGASYATWHNQIDPIYWCYFHHEHGSDPAYFASDYRSVYGYAAAAHGMSEPHTGFKNVVFDDDAGTRWLVTLHMGTSGLGRACARFHTLDIAARSIATGELLADLHFMGDYGPSLVNVTKEPFYPVSCPDQAIQAQDSRGVRQLPTLDTGAIGYEPWRVGVEATILGLGNNILINNTDPMVICNSDICDQAVTTGDSGSTRFLEGDFTITAGTQNSGVFYTDALGRTFLSQGDAGAVRQYIKPGLNLTMQLGAKCRDVNAWGQPFICSSSISGAPPTNREGSLQIPN